MGFPTFTFPIDQIGTVELVFPIGDLLDHGTRCLAVGRRAVGWRASDVAAWLAARKIGELT